MRQYKNILFYQEPAQNASSRGLVWRVLLGRLVNLHMGEDHLVHRDHLRLVNQLVPESQEDEDRLRKT